jgi:hypothetical protein
MDEIAASAAEGRPAAMDLEWTEPWRRALSGLQAGVVGAVAVLVFFILSAKLQGQPWWSTLNILGSTVYQHAAFWRGFGRVTFAGMAVQVFWASVVGILFGLAFARVRSFLAGLVIGMLTGVAWFYLSHRALFPWVSPLVPVYAPQPATLIGHVLFGLSLAGTPLFYRAFFPAPVPPVITLAPPAGLEPLSDPAGGDPMLADASVHAPPEAAEAVESAGPDGAVAEAPVSATTPEPSSPEAPR